MCVHISTLRRSRKRTGIIIGTRDCREFASSALCADVCRRCTTKRVFVICAGGTVHAHSCIVQSSEWISSIVLFTIKKKPALYAPTTAEYLPAGQFLQVAWLEAADASLNLPAAQSVQKSEPTEDLYLPASHGAHPAGNPVYPAIQKQSVLPATLPECTGHFKHVDCPGSEEYFPA